MFDFDHNIDRRNSESIKWNAFAEDVIPMWIADMDFYSPQSVARALEKRVQHGVFGYGIEEPGLREAVCAWVGRRYDWKIEPDQMLFIPGVVTGLNWVVQKLLNPEDKILIQTPVYPPFFKLAENAASSLLQISLGKESSGRYFMEFSGIESAVHSGLKAIILCNPHNPVGRVFSREELTKLAEFCVKNDLFIISDEIHADLIYKGRKHVPIASLGKAVSERCITLLAPSKTFNIAGLYCSVLVCQNAELLRKLEMNRAGLITEPNILAQVAAKAAYLSGEEWLDELMIYLDKNRKLIGEYIRDEMPSLNYTLPEGMFLAWIDCSALPLDVEPADFFLKNARVALSPGRIFGEDGERFVRLNFGCTHAVLEKALKRMNKAYKHI